MSLKSNDGNLSLMRRYLRKGRAATEKDKIRLIYSNKVSKDEVLPLFITNLNNLVD
jgi:hypothetical protein